MADLLTGVRTVLADLNSDELEILFATPLIGGAASTGLLAWIEHAADWELSRRKGFDFHLTSPDEAIDPTEDAVAITSAIALQQEFVKEPAIAQFFAATVDVLIGRGQRQ